MTLLEVLVVVVIMAMASTAVIAGFLPRYPMNQVDQVQLWSWQLRDLARQHRTGFHIRRDGTSTSGGIPPPIVLTLTAPDSVDANQGSHIDANGFSQDLLVEFRNPNGELIVRVMDGWSGNLRKLTDEHR